MTQTEISELNEVLKKSFKDNCVSYIIKTAIRKAIDGDVDWAEWLRKYGYATPERQNKNC